MGILSKFWKCLQIPYGISIWDFPAAGTLHRKPRLRKVLIYRKLARLNSAVGVFEYEVDPEGKTQTKIWEWK